MINHKICIVIPALNPDEQFESYVKQLIQNGAEQIIIVNDGSQKQYLPIFQNLETLPQCLVLHHPVNLGKGQALKTAMAAYTDHYLSSGCIGIITVDADGQHAITDVEKISNNLEKNPNSLIMGERGFDQKVPIRSRFGNSCTAIIFRFLYGIQLHDTQTGLRGIPNTLIPLFIKLDGSRYEYEMNMLIACSRHKIPIKSTEIHTIYLNNNESSHFNPFADSIKIYSLLFGTFFRYTFASLSSFLIDILLFELGILVGKKLELAGYIIISTVIARIISATYNFLINHHLVFKSIEKLHHTFYKYFLLCVLQMLLSALAVNFIYFLYPVSEVATKLLVDTLLFFISFRIQKNWIFCKSR